MNKNGWGLRVELLYILMFLFCLVIATIGLNRLGLLGENPDALIKPDTEEKEVYSYEPLERKVVEAAKKYYIDNYSDSSEDIVIIRTSTLISNSVSFGFTSASTGTPVMASIIFLLSACIKSLPS